jgi:hypothetical protein
VSDPKLPGDLPPDLPPEYADAYRRAYERALRGAGEVEPEPPVVEAPMAEPVPPPPEPGPEPHVAEPEATQRLEGYDRLFAGEPARYPQDEPPHRDSEPETPDERPAWLVPALLAGLVVLLIAGAYGLGLLFSSSVDDADVASEQPDGVVLGEDGSTSATPSKSDKDGSPAKDRYEGRTEAAGIGGATASCEAPPSVDAAGNRIRYEPANTYDGDLSTAWRCNGDGVGQTLTLSLAEGVRIGEVGLVPGYAKTDPRSGADRYAENNRITRVRWTFADGTSIVQPLDGSATNREMQTVRIPLTDSHQVEIEVLASTPGARNTIAVSEVRVGQATG